MAPNDKVTHEDLLRLKNEITKEQTEYRHDDRRKMQEQFVVIDDLREESILAKHIIDTMKKDLQEIKTTLKDGFKDISNKFEGLPKEFVTRVEHDANKQKIEKIEEVLSWTAKIVIGAVILALLGLVIAKTGITAP